MTKIVAAITCFFAGAVASMNLTGLMPTNPGYDHQWWKVAFSIVVGIMAVIYISQDKS